MRQVTLWLFLIWLCIARRDSTLPSSKSIAVLHSIDYASWYSRGQFNCDIVFVACQLERKSTWLWPVEHTDRSLFAVAIIDRLSLTSALFFSFEREQKKRCWSTESFEEEMNSTLRVRQGWTFFFFSVFSSMIIVGIRKWAKGQWCSRRFDWSTHTHIHFFDLTNLIGINRNEYFPSFSSSFSHERWKRHLIIRRRRRRNCRQSHRQFFIRILMSNKRLICGRINWINLCRHSIREEEEEENLQFDIDVTRKQK